MTALLLTAALIGAPSPIAPRSLVHPPAVVAPREPSQPTLLAKVPVPGHHLRGIASWGRGWAGVVTRLPRGTRICVSGPLGRWCGRSVGYGPARWTHRIADLSPAVFGAVCGPLSAGLCRITLSWTP